MEVGRYPVQRLMEAGEGAALARWPRINRDSQLEAPGRLGQGRSWVQFVKGLVLGADS